MNNSQKKQKVKIQPLRGNRIIKKVNIKRSLSEKDNYKSDKWLLKMFEGWFDPCPLNPDLVQIYLESNGLRMDWEDKTYVNPPYSDPLPWVEKAIEESKKGCYVVMLLKVDTSTRWFYKLLEAKAEILYGGIFI